MRNPLLNYRTSAARGVQVVEERSADVYEILVRQNKQILFTAAQMAGKAAAENKELTEEEKQVLYTDTKLQTQELPEKLESRLLNTYYTARTSIEEQGVNILYLALGMLEWYESESSEISRLAPLILVPADLLRGSAKERFKLKYSGAEVETNLSLQAKLKSEFGIELPQISDQEEIDISSYFQQVKQAIQQYKRWQVQENTIALGFFSFGKFLLYRDLDLSLWPKEANIEEHPLLEAIFETGFRDPQPSVGEEAFLDKEPSVHELHQVVDADSSQLLAMLAVQEGRNLVIQGPPGTGKSQTITNILAEAIGAGKKVLFVAEKMAALEVVKRRLDSIGLGDACLELHSHKANKKALHEELKRTLELNKPLLQHLEQEVALLEQHRDELNNYTFAVNQPIGNSNLPAQRIMGELLQIGEKIGDAELPRPAFKHIADWNSADMQQLETLAEKMQALAEKTGKPRDLIFWGSERKILLPADIDKLANLLREATESVENLALCSAELALILGLAAPEDRLSAEALLPVARLAMQAPKLSGIDSKNPLFLHRHFELQELLEAGKKLSEIKQKHKQTYRPEAWETDVAELREQFVTNGDKWWNFLIGGHSKAKGKLKSLLAVPLPKTNAERLALTEDLLEANRYLKTLREHQKLADELFSFNWQREQSDWAYLKQVSQFLKQVHEGLQNKQIPKELLTYLSANPDRAALAQPVQKLQAALENHLHKNQELTTQLELDETRRFGADGRLLQQPFWRQLRVLNNWLQRLPELQLVIDWNNLSATAKQHGLSELVSLAETWPHAGKYLQLVLRKTWLEYLLEQAYRQHEPLRKFERAGHHEIIRRFRTADQMQFHYNRARAALAHWEQVPRHGAGGQLGVLMMEFNKKARHKPIRRLMEEAGLAVQAIKPVFMMSPLSIANFLPPAALDFDLVVFDEASQVKPVEAIGAIMRGKQLVVVGDSKQLPPTSFFDSITGNFAEEDEDNITADIQSILGLCEAKMAPSRMLRWHYRSRHESLIKVSNHEFYDNRLVIFPSPGHARKLGLFFHHLPETVYERGGSRSNPLEAEAVANAVMQHARQHPELTLGVATFSTAQREAIENALELRRRQSPETEQFFNRHPHEPFFIKNLENVQGDERDVILISMGYGRSKEGYMGMNFGPLNGDGGERRLNVLITRARQRCEVFCNFTADDLDLSRTNSIGVAALKTFLQFAQRGILDVPQQTGRDFDSPFEEQVYKALARQGCEVQKQVGSKGFYIDLAIADPEQPGRYLLGIECDGAMYHSARSARDRDRLRQQVLESVGWKLHRIWSTDWFRNPERELKRVLQALQEAKIYASETKTNKEPAAVAGLLREAETEAAAINLPPYEMAQLPAGVAQKELHRHSLHQLSVWVTEVVRVESPVHETEVFKRIADAAGAARIGNRIRESLEQAVRLAVNKNAIRKQGNYLWMATMRAPELRDRSLLPASSRKISLIAPEELALAVQQAVRQSFGIEKDDVALHTVRLLGYGRLTEDMREVAEKTLQRLIVEGVLEEKNGVVRVL